MLYALEGEPNDPSESLEYSCLSERSTNRAGLDLGEGGESERAEAAEDVTETDRFSRVPWFSLDVCRLDVDCDKEVEGKVGLAIVTGELKKSIVRLRREEVTEEVSLAASLCLRFLD